MTAMVFNPSFVAQWQTCHYLFIYSNFHHQLVTFCVKAFSVISIY